MGRKLPTLCLAVIFPGERNAVEKDHVTSLIRFLKRSGGGGRADDAIAECRQLAAPRAKLLVKASWAQCEKS